MIPALLATSKESIVVRSWLNTGLLFFIRPDQSVDLGLQSSFTACLAWCLLVVISTVNPSELLLFSVFFLVDTVVRGSLLIT